MNSRDDPFGDGKTVIKQPRASQHPARAAHPAPARAPARADQTVFDPGFASRRVEGWNEAPDTAGHHASNTSGLDWQSLEEAGKLITGRSANPLIAAAAPVLILLGQLRQAPPKADPAVLADHFAQRIDDFELTVTRNGVDDSDARVARYVMCEMVDDIMQTLPDYAPSVWMPIGMLSRFFRTDAAGAGFFDALNRALGKPDKHCDLIELIHTCLSLGFEGQYRGMENGAERLARIRNDTYQVLRHYRPIATQDLSPQWQPVVLKGRHRRPVVPVWAVAAVGCALVAGAFIAVRDRIAQQGEAVAAEILSATPSAAAGIQHLAFVPVFASTQPPASDEVVPSPPATPAPRSDVQLERIRSALAAAISDGKLSVGTKGDYILVEIDNRQLFQPGKAVLKPDFESLVEPVVAALSNERGPVKIVGHTDSDKLARTSAFKSNYDLSVARAQAVEKRLSTALAGKITLEVEGKGEDEPVADNATADGKARNRRIDLLIARGPGA